MLCEVEELNVVVVDDWLFDGLWGANRKARSVGLDRGVHEGASLFYANRRISSRDMFSRNSRETIFSKSVSGFHASLLADGGPSVDFDCGAAGSRETYFGYVSMR